MCKHCGYCEHCGRGGYHPFYQPAPFNHQPYYTQPGYINPGPFWQISDQSIGRFYEGFTSKGTTESVQVSIQPDSTWT